VIDEPFKVTGLDLSYTSTGVAVRDQVGDISVYRLAQGKRLKGHARLLYLRQNICALARGSHRITVEGAAYSRDQGQHKMGGLWWIIMHCLWMENPQAEVVVVDPNTLKQYALGKRSAEKGEIVAVMVRRYPFVMVTNDDEADALVLLAMTLDWMGTPLATAPGCSVTQAHRAALKSWPYKHIEEL
jgi:Holliday junction resolvasome RuvABC endonuclease subunit